MQKKQMRCRDFLPSRVPFLLGYSGFVFSLPSVMSPVTPEQTTYLSHTHTHTHTINQKLAAYSHNKTQTDMMSQHTTSTLI